MLRVSISSTITITIMAIVITDSPESFSLLCSPLLFRRVRSIVRRTDWVRVVKRGERWGATGSQVEKRKKGLTERQPPGGCVGDWDPFFLIVFFFLFFPIVFSLVFFPLFISFFSLLFFYVAVRQQGNG